MPDFTPGDRLGPYVILGFVGQGGMAEVYRALQPLMKREVALKVIPSRFRAHFTAALFAKEVEVSGRLSHSGIARAYDAGEADGCPYLVCEYIDGQTLHETVVRDGPLTTLKAVDYTLQAARALLHAHNHGVVHRDIKPANLLLDRCDVVRLIDFGLAWDIEGLLPFNRHKLNRIRGETRILDRYGEPNLDIAASVFVNINERSFRRISRDPNLSRVSSWLVGTPMYMSPEQTVSARVDRRSDIYSLGCTLYYLLTGLPIFSPDPGRRSGLVQTGTSEEQTLRPVDGPASPSIADVLFAHRRGLLPALRERAPAVPPVLETVFRRMVARLPVDRYPSASKLIADLEAVHASLRQARAVFLSYRRDDSLDATFRLYETLSERLGAGAVLMDMDGIPPGVDFRRFLDEAVSGCQVLLAVIGDHWAGAQDERGDRRLDQPMDFVRLEIRTALELNKPVIPVLVGRAAIPTAEVLPADIRALAFRHAVELRPGPSYRQQLNGLVGVLEQILSGQERR
jgi:serine/threonine protein kinase